jgi:hypothetical protein
MAFFGLTALGPQNCFSQADLQARNFHIFDEEDFLKSWYKIAGPGAKFAGVNQLGDIMRVLFRGPIPPADQRQVTLNENIDMDFFECPARKKKKIFFFNNLHRHSAD